MRAVRTTVLFLTLVGSVAPAGGLAATAGHADLAFAPATVGPLPCGAAPTLEFVYTPGPGTPDLRGYTVTIRPVGPAVGVAASDFTNRDPWGTAPPVFQFFDVQDNGDGSFTVSGAKLGGTSGLAGPAPLFALVVHAAGHGSAGIAVSDPLLRDLDNGEIPTDAVNGAAVVVDCWPPDPVSAIVALPLHERVRVSWTDSPSPDVSSYQVWRGLWHDGAHHSIYPEYDDVPNQVPTRPVWYAPLDPSEWTLVGTYPVGVARPVIDAIAPRGVYYYEVFAVDQAGNRSAPATLNARSANYWLGDIEPYVDGLVEVGDISVLGDAFGTADGDALYRPEADVGPTDDHGRLGVPQTDDAVDFEDLMVFAMNFGFAFPRAPAAPGGGAPVLTFVRLDDTTWALRLDEACPSLKGLRLTAALPPGAAPIVAAGELLGRQAAPVFLRNVGTRGLDASVALLGQGACLAGEGELLRVTLPAGVAPAGTTVIARGVGNERLSVLLRAGDAPPAAPRLETISPNPFNPSAAIAFTLPAKQRAALAVYTLGGRRVATLVDAELAGGRHEVVWNGRDGGGRPAAAGTYVCRLETGGRTLSRKMSLVK